MPSYAAVRLLSTLSPPRALFFQIILKGEKSFSQSNITQCSHKPPIASHIYISGENLTNADVCFPTSIRISIEINILAGWKGHQFASHCHNNWIGLGLLVFGDSFIANYGYFIANYAINISILKYEHIGTSYLLLS